MKNLFIPILFLLTSQTYSQNVCISADNSLPDNSAMLEIRSSNTGLLIPRLSSAEREAIVNPAIGLQIYNLDRKCIEFYTGTQWTGFVPAGTVEAFFGQTVPDGWLLCDGSEISRTTYSDLFAAIGISCGYGDNSSTFNLPDLRGRFLRGVSGSSGNDPDAATRSAMNTGGNTGNTVGSLQGDATKLPTNAFTISTNGDHNHSIGWVVDAGVVGGNVYNPGATTNTGHFSTSGYGMVGGGYVGNSGNHSHSITGGDTETRTKNVYVKYIIKY
jgi:microcystin-dependent protein